MGAGETIAGKISVLMVDDSAVLRLGLLELASVDPELEAIGSAENGREAVAKYRELKPDVVVMDYEMPEVDGINATKEILKEDPQARIILLSVHESEEDVWNAVQAGVKGYLTKKAGDIEEVLEAIHEVANGSDYFPDSIVRKLKRRENQEELSEPEMSVLKLLGHGLSNKEIEDQLGISMAMVKFHIVNLRGKLGATDRTQAVIIASRRGLLKL